ncbi:hypothetical protein ACQPZF_21670 [Actinosynnema sp. CS-041913]|uniref:hypothetical protein n=1 Tax=Actinosynnema sp. CS-041913 TaxID=3239917 RepID=UPI003D8DDD84
MSDPSRPPARSVVVTLFAVAACAVVAASVLTAVAVADDRPGRDGPVADGDRTSPTPRTSTSRAAGLPMCLVGSWRAVDEQFMIKFYTDEEPMRFTSSGRRYEFRADGTAIERQDNVVLSSTFQGNELRVVGNGQVDFKWTANDKQITYLARTATTLSWSYYDQRGLINTQPQEPTATLNEVDDYTCEGNQVVESNASGYRAVWVRTDGSGVYG